MEESTRPATGADGSDLLRLAALARAELAVERDGPMYLLADAPPGPRSDDPLGGARPGGDGVNSGGVAAPRACWMACLDGLAVGYATARLDDLPGGRPLAVLEEVFVEAGARDMSLGEMLLGDVIAWAAAAEAVGIDAIALPGARDTKNFFEANGFKARVLTVHRPLDAHPGRGTRRR